MKRERPILLVPLVIIAMCALVPSMSGQDDEGAALGVARVSLTNGDVTMRRGDSGDWIQARVNMPLVEGDSVATGRASRAEVQLDHSNLLRLNEDTRLNVAELGNRKFRIQLESGILTYSELRGGEADIDIETPLVAVRPRERGLYRVEVFDQDRVIVTVRKGEAEIASSEGLETLKQGRTMIVRSVGEGSEFQTAKAQQKDDWDRWNERRDEQLRKSESYQYVSRSIYGAEDLDHHGRWSYVPGYGRCWFPSVAVGWAPYSHGRWIWLDYYGWSWVGYEPWGWAPYHYGRWFRHAHYGWGWYPGPHYSHHYWRPALVSFFGFGGHHGFGFGIGVGFGHGFRHIGWVPLAPGERFHPWYGRHVRRFGRGGGRGNTTIIVDNSVNVVNRFRNARHRNAVTVVDADGFGRGLVNRRRQLPENELRRASQMRGQIPVVPDRESQGRVVRAANNGTESVTRGGSRNNRFFTTNSTPQRSSRTPFDRQRQQVSSSIRAFGEARARQAAETPSSEGNSAAQSRIGRSRVGGGASRGTGAPASAAVEPNTDMGPSTRGIRSRRTAESVGDNEPATRAGRSAATDPAARSGSGRGFPRAAAGATPAAEPESTNRAMPQSSRSSSSADVSSRWRRFGGSEGRSARIDGNNSSTRTSRRGARSSATTTPGGTARGNAGRSSGRSARSSSSPSDSGGVRSSETQGRSSTRSSGAWRRFGSSNSGSSRATTPSRQAAPATAGRGSRGASSSPDNTRQRGSERSSGPRRFAPRSSSRAESSGSASRSAAEITTRSPSGSRSGGRSRAVAPNSSSSSGIFGSSRSSRGGVSRSPSSSSRTEGSRIGTSRSSRVPRSGGFSRAPVSRSPSVSRPSPSRSGSSRGVFGSSRSSRSSGRGAISAGGGSRGGGSVSRGSSASRGGGSFSRGGRSASRSSGGGSRGAARSGGRGRR